MFQANANKDTVPFRSLPTSVQWAIALVACGVLACLYELFTHLIRARLTPLDVLLLSINGAILIGLVRGEQSAWQWARVIGLLAAGLLSLSTAALVGAAIAGAQFSGVQFAETSSPVGAAALLALFAAALWAAYLTLGLPSARAHYGIE